MLEKTTNLSTQIKKVIGFRILSCFLLSLSTVFALTMVEIASSLHQLEKNIKEECKTLESYVISQVLVKNNDAIQPKLDSLKSQSHSINFTLNSESSKLMQLQWSLPLSWKYLYPVKNTEGITFGTFVVTGSLLNDHAIFFNLFITLALLTILFSIIFVMLYPLGNRIPKQLFIEPINNLLMLLKKEKNKFENCNSLKLPEEIREIKDKITTLLYETEERLREVALGQIAMQVAHDIRSPLIALNVETEELYSISEKKRIAIRNAVQRVNDIANNLLSQYNQNKNKILSDQEELKSEPLIIMLESILSEKRIQISNTPILIKLEKCPEAHKFFVKVDIAGFKRTISNIINNSIEAIKEKGLINVKVNKNNNNILVTIIDNGCGIPKHQLPLVLENGVSFGKPGGSGLGLSYILNKIYSWHGNYAIKSEVNEGTTFEMILPETRPSAWFMNHLYIPNNCTIIILDDDEYIHTVWNDRFSNILNENTIELLHFYTSDEFEKYCSTKNNTIRIFFLDYELGANSQIINGLALAESLNINNYATLVTNNYEDYSIREICLRLNMKILPKSYVTSVSIKIIKNVDLIFIDDDEAITSIWEEKAKLSKINIEVFNDIYAFMDVYKLYNKNTPIYLDSSLGGSLKGEDFAKILFENGYNNLTLSTSYQKQIFKNIPWIKQVIDKYPPF